VAVLAGECKNPERTIGRATLIAAPIIAVMFIMGTSSVLAFTGSEQIDLIGPIPQTLRAGLGFSGIGAIVAPIAILLLTTRILANNSIVFTCNTRMPLVAGWDRLLPGWFTRLHARFRTPVNSILFVGAISIVFGIAGSTGVGHQEAFQLLDNAAGIFYGLTYGVLFIIPLMGARRTSGRLPAAPLWLKAASVSGLLVSILYVTLSIFPIIDVASWASFAGKISSVVVGLNLLGLGVYVVAQRRRSRLVEWESAAAVRAPEGSPVARPGSVAGETERR
jgi:glutamate:GABA antiporter